MPDLASIFAAGLPTISATVGRLTGSLIQAGTTTAFSRAHYLEVEQLPGGGQRDNLTRRLSIPEDGITGVVPLAGSRLTVTGDSTSWLVESAEPFAPGGTVVSWTLTLKDWDARPI
jgi:hypothetical protein